MTASATPITKQSFESHRGARPLYPIFLLFRAIADILMRWQQRAFERSQLRDLEEHHLDDMGMTLGARDAEAGKPFWRA